MPAPRTCDACGRSCDFLGEPTSVQIEVVVDRQRSPEKFDGYADTTETVALCAQCCGKQLEGGLKALSFKQREEWVQRIRGAKR